MRQVIVNADDVGLCESVNRGVFEAAQHGIVTSVSVMANGRAFDDGMATLRRCPGLDIGVHLTLVEERPVLESSHLRSLLTRHGRLPPSWNALLERMMLNARAVDESEAESRAQIERVLSMGVPVSHLDSHQHMPPSHASLREAKRWGAQWRGWVLGPVRGRGMTDRVWGAACVDMAAS